MLRYAPTSLLSPNKLESCSTDTSVFKHTPEEKSAIKKLKESNKNSLREVYGNTPHKHLNIPSNQIGKGRMSF